jgi:hypothetical protein
LLLLVSHHHANYVITMSSVEVSAFPKWVIFVVTL